MLLKKSLWKGLDLVVAYLSLENCRACKKPVNNRHVIKPPQSLCMQCWLKLHKELTAAKTLLTLKAGTMLVQAAGVHSGLLRKLIIKLKQSEDPLLAYDLSYLMAQNSQLSFKFKQVIIIPVPLHKKRLHTRGFNQSELLAKSLSAWLGFPMSTRMLKRTRDMRSQRGLHKDQRWINMQEAFTAQSNKIQGQNILLIDDVYTSGATMQAAAQALFNAGATCVMGMTIAVAPLLRSTKPV